VVEKGGRREAKHGKKGLEVRGEVENVTSKLKYNHEALRGFRVENENL